MKKSKPLSRKYDARRKVKLGKPQIELTHKNHKRRTIIELTIIALLIIFAILLYTVFKYTDFGILITQALSQFIDISESATAFKDQIIKTVAAIVVVWILSRLIHYTFSLMVNKKRRKATFIILLRSILKYSVIIIGIFIILGFWGINADTLLVSAGLLGLVISFGAQGLIEDLFAGLFIMLEGQYQVGDIVYIDGFRGKVLEINLRTTRFLDLLNLDIKYISNRDVRNVINASQRNSVAICDFSVDYNAHLETVEKVILKALPDIQERNPEILDLPVYLGVQKLAESGVVLRITALTVEDDKLQVERILNREIKLLFDKNNISIPYPQLTISNQKPIRKKSTSLSSVKKTISASKK